MIWDLLTPALVIFILGVAVWRRVDLFDGLTAGGKDGLMILLRIVPALVPLLAAITMLKASGALDAFAELCRPLFSVIGIPPECAPLLIIRPFSGSGALAMGAELIAEHGADSVVGRTAAVMLGSTETTFYAISVICGAAGVRKTRYILPAALCADLTASIAAAWAVRFFQ